MGIQWYPGHMTKARRELAEWMPSQDVIIEVLDARMPAASANPIVSEIRDDKPCIKVLSKSDLADPLVTKQWLSLFGGQRNVIAVEQTAEPRSRAKLKIPELCQRLAPHRLGPHKTVRAMVVGIPNVGKSTLINMLMDRKVAKVGDEPAVTKARQHVTLPNGMSLWDCPGILWPKIEDDSAALRLALGGAIPDAALDYESVATFGAQYFLERYPDLLRARYKLKELPLNGEALLDEIGRRRGGLRSGGRVDRHKAADVLIHEFRSGALGRISLESPK